ncbi:MAG: AraC family transcriptional regulator [Candidatus Merdivicinus sp.]
MLKPKRATVFRKLFITYSLLVCVTVFATAGIAQAFYMDAYTDEVEIVHRRMLLRTTEIISSEVIEPSARMMMELYQQYTNHNENLYSFDQEGEHSAVQMVNTCAYLREFVARYNQSVKRIDVYYPEDNLILSSLSGLLYLDERGSFLPEDFSWISYLKQNGIGRSIFSTPELKSYTQDGELFFCRTYPLTTSLENCEGVIALTLNDETISEVLGETMVQQGVDVYLTDGDQYVILSSDPAMKGTILEDSPYQDIAASQESYGSFPTHFGGKEYNLSFSRIPGTDWTLIHRIPLGDFYQEASKIRLILLGICAALVLFGTALCYLIAYRVYSPLQVLINKMRTSAAMREMQDVDEYDVINGVVTQLSSRVGDLQTALEANYPIVRHHYFWELLHNPAISRDLVEERARMFQFDPSLCGYCSIVITFPKKDYSRITPENQQYILYGILCELDRIQDDELLLFGIEGETMSVEVVAASRFDKECELDSILQRLYQYTSSNFLLRPVISAGEWVENVYGLSESYHHASSAVRYYWYNPTCYILDGNKIAKREQNTDSFPSEALQKWEESLHSGNRKQCEESLYEFCRLLQEGSYCDAVCQEALTLFLHSLTLAIRERYPTLSKQEKQEYAECVISAPDIDVFREEVLRWIPRLTEEQSVGTNRNADLIGYVCSYIREHLADELSLDLIADMIHISPRYFSKIFKDETGVNFTAYVNTCRLEKAEQLLLQTNQNIQEIAQQVGYHTSTYFIQQFSRKYGITPYHYRRNHHISE